MTLWVARAGKHGERELYALENNVVVGGWDKVPDASAISSRKEACDLVAHSYPEKMVGTTENWGRQLWAFVKRFEVGDLVALPFRGHGSVAFGEIVKPYKYVGDAPHDARHQHDVKWLDTLVRSEIDGDIRRSLGAAMTIFKVKAENAEARIRAMLEGGKTPSVVKNEDDDALGDNNEVSTDLAQEAVDRIIDYIDKNFKEHDLAWLVNGVLRAQGYFTHFSPPGPDGGVDILAGRGPMGLDSPRLCVQVKSGKSKADVKVYRELGGVIEPHGAEQGLLVSWGGFKDSVLKEGKKEYFKIRLWDQNEFVRAICESYDKLDDELQAELPLKRVWMLVEDSDEE